MNGYLLTAHALAGERWPFTHFRGAKGDNVERKAMMGWVPESWAPFPTNDGRNSWRVSLRFSGDTFADPQPDAGALRLMSCGDTGGLAPSRYQLSVGAPFGAGHPFLGLANLVNAGRLRTFAERKATMWSERR